MPRTYDFITDPGHGWLKVPRAELVRLGIENDITVYSYVRGEYAYLEEDVDYATFLNAKNARGETFKVRERNADYRGSKVRTYDAYVAPNRHYVVDGHRFNTYGEAIGHANYTHRKNGVIVAVEVL